MPVYKMKGHYPDESLYLPRWKKDEELSRSSWKEADTCAISVKG